MKPLALLTMVYDDDLFLKIFLDYWERFLPRGNIFVLMHADYEKYEAMAEGCNTMRIHRPEITPDSERDRWQMISQIASGLSFQFDRVIYTDVDEIVALDPQVGDDPVAYILSQSEPVIAPMGVDLVHDRGSEPAVDPDKPILVHQRRHFAFNTRYSKPAIIAEPVRWGSGGHNCTAPDHCVDPNLTLFHLRLFDETVLEDRARARLKLVSDSETGDLIDGLGGRTWRVGTEDLDRFVHSEKPLPEDRIYRARLARKSYEVRKMHGDMVVRSGRATRELLPIPSRYAGVF